MFGPHPDDMTPLATSSDAMSEWGWNVGWYSRNIGSAYLLHDWDVWVKNPHYAGPACPHPDDDEPMSSEAVAWQEHAERLLLDDRTPEFWEGYAYIRVR